MATTAIKHKQQPQPSSRSSAAAYDSSASEGSSSNASSTPKLSSSSSNNARGRNENEAPVATLTASKHISSIPIPQHKMASTSAVKLSFPSVRAQSIEESATNSCSQEQNNSDSDENARAIVSDCEMPSLSKRSLNTPFNISNVSSTSGRTSISPRCEAFVMTGEKMLRLNSKISPNFARLKQTELPEHAQILESPTIVEQPEQCEHEVVSKYQYTKRHKLLQAENKQRSVPNSQSENLLAGSENNAAAVSDGRDDSVDDDVSKASCVTVNAMCPTSLPGSASHRASDATQSASTLPRGQLSNIELHSMNGDTVSVGGGPSSDLPSPTSPFISLSEPVSPAKYPHSGLDAKRLGEISEHDDYESGDVAPTWSASSGGLANNVTQSFKRNQVHVMVETARHFKTSRMEDNDENLEDSVGLPKQRLPLDLESTLGLGISQKEPDPEAASRLAKRLYYLEGFRKIHVAPHLSKNNEFSALVAREYLRMFNFASLRLDAALREFLSHFCLIGETAERERIVTYFSRRYHECNPGLLGSEEEVHTLTCALLLLNTDLHGSNLSKRMSCYDFIENLTQTSNAKFPRDLLKTLYGSLKTHPLEWAADRNHSGSTTDSGLPSQSQLLDDRFLQIPDPDSQVEYKKGWVMRKSLIEPDGSKTPLGRRGWKMYYATLKGLILYLHKRGTYNTFRNATRMHHCLATKASDYGKKQHVFRVQTATYAEFLFQTSDPDELNSWVDALNFVSACFSSPALPPPVGSRQKFYRLVLPSVPSQLSMIENLLEEHRSNAPQRNAKPKALQEYAEIEIYYQNELTRYKTYVYLLRLKMNEYLAQDDHTTIISSSFSREMNEKLMVGSNCLATSSTNSGSDKTDRSSYKIAIYANNAGSANNGDISNSMLEPVLSMSDRETNF